MKSFLKRLFLGSIKKEKKSNLVYVVHSGNLAEVVHRFDDGGIQFRVLESGTLITLSFGDWKIDTEKSNLYCFTKVV